MYTHIITTDVAKNLDNGNIEPYYTAHIFNADGFEVASLSGWEITDTITAAENFR